MTVDDNLDPGHHHGSGIRVAVNIAVPATGTSPAQWSGSNMPTPDNRREGKDAPIGCQADVVGRAHDHQTQPKREEVADRLVVVLPEGVRSPERMQHYVSEAVGCSVQLVAVAVDALTIEAGDPAVLEEAFRPNARARAVLRGVRQAHDLLAESGGAYELDEVRTILGDISRAAVAKMEREGRLLTLPGPQGRRVFPTLQFRSDGSVIDGLEKVRSALPSSNPWSFLVFLAGNNDALDGRKPIDLLRSGDAGHRDLLLLAAQGTDTQGS